MYVIYVCMYVCRCTYICMYVILCRCIYNDSIYILVHTYILYSIVTTTLWLWNLKSSCEKDTIEFENTA